MNSSSQSGLIGPPLIGIVAAYRAEVAALLHLVRSVRRAAQGDFRISLPQGEAVLAISGAGRANARRAAQQLARQHQLGSLISIGFAGGLDEGLTAGRVLVAASVKDSVSGREYGCAHGFFPCATELTGSLVTVATVAATRDAKAALRTRWQAAAADMEASAVADVAANCGLPYAALKAITDGPADELAIDFQQCLTANGGLSSVKIVIQGLRGLTQFRSLLLLARNSRTAARNLAVALAGPVSRY